MLWRFLAILIVTIFIIGSGIVSGALHLGIPGSILFGMMCGMLGGFIATHVWFLGDDY